MLAVSPPARAAEAHAPARIDAQLFSGVVSGGGLEGALGAVRAGASASVYMFHPVGANRLPTLGQGHAALRVMNGARVDLDFRVGYLYGRFDYGWRAGSTVVDHQHCVDAGVTLRVHSHAGYVASLDVTREQVWRSPIEVDETKLRGGGGWRVAVTGDFALATDVAFFIKGEMRTGPHVPQSGILPLALLGFSFRL